ncbi:MAG TPA: cupin domain-containing protein [Candidatus Sulfotelmatobacter sp.]|nr:cupin domain-containing protein [Candidatus Sulfotelmatobacter sp.]
MALIVPTLAGQEHKTDPTWLHRFLSLAQPAKADASDSCQYQPLFGKGDKDASILRSLSRFGAMRISPHSTCPDDVDSSEESLRFVLNGKGFISYNAEDHAIHPDDFTYLAPALKRTFRSDSDQGLTVIVMDFKVPTPVSLPSKETQPKIVNLADIKEETVSGHPSSVLYKLMVGSRGATRDAIDDATVVTSLFLMDFAPGGTNWPHHHETAEEVYLVLDGTGDMVAGSGMDGVEARFPAKAGDAYYFRPNCTVGFYNQNHPGAKAHILAVRSRIPLPEAD